MSTCPSPSPNHTDLQKSCLMCTCCTACMPCIGSHSCRSRSSEHCHAMHNRGRLSAASTSWAIAYRATRASCIVALKMVPLSLEQMPCWCALAVLDQATVWHCLLPVTCA